MKGNLMRFSVVLILIVLTLLISCKSPKAKMAKSPAHHCNLGQLYFTQGMIQDAIAEMKKATEMDPKNAVFFQWLGYFYFSAGKQQEAEEAYKQALQVNPYLTEVHSYLGALYDQMGRREEALKHYNIVLADRFYPTPENIYYNLSFLYEQEGNLQEAVDQLRKAVEKNPKFYDAHFQLAKILDKLGKYEDAVFEYKVAEISYKQDPAFQFLYAMAYMKLGDTEKAKQHFKKVIDLAPGTPDSIKARDIMDTLK